MTFDKSRKILAGARLRKLREELGLSQSAMANELGISISYQNLIERNLRPITAQLLIKLSETYAVDPSSFAQAEDQREAHAFAEIFADPMFQSAAVPNAEIKTLIDQAPTLAEAVKRLFGGYREIRDRMAVSAHLAGASSDRGDTQHVFGHDAVEDIRHFLQQANNHFPALETRASELVQEMRGGGQELWAALVHRLMASHGIRVQVMPVNVMGKILRRYDAHRKRLILSELMEPSGRLFQMAYQLGLLEAGDILDAHAASIDTEQGRKLARVSLANYFGAAVMMPYEEFLNAAEQLAYDTDVLSARFSASFEQVAHRLTTLARPSARGVPFFMIRVDNAGNVSKRFSSGTFPFSKFGGTCPRWNIHRTFHNPGRIETQIIELPDGAKWFSIARTVRRLAAPWGEEDSQFVVGLGCELKHAARLVYAKGVDLKDAPVTPIGVNCRLCERINCIQRAAPPLSRPLDVNENVRGYSPFDVELRG